MLIMGANLTRFFIFNFFILFIILKSERFNQTEHLGIPWLKLT